MAEDRNYDAGHPKTPFPPGLIEQLEPAFPNPLDKAFAKARMIFSGEQRFIGRDLTHGVIHDIEGSGWEKPDSGVTGISRADHRLRWPNGG